MEHQEDDRIIAIRCLGCHRLRAHPVDFATYFCVCGDMRFSSTMPLPDEEKLAVKLYGRQIEERNLWKNLF